MASTSQVLPDRMVEPDKFPLVKIRLISELHDPAEIHLKVPTLIHRQLQNVATKQSDQAFVAEGDDVLTFVPGPFFLDEIRDPFHGFFPCFTLWKAKVGISFGEPLPNFREPCLDLLLFQSIDQPVIDFVQLLIHDRRELEVLC